MLGLIKKDLLMARGNFKTIIIMLVVFVFTAINGNENFSFIPSFLSVIVMLSTFSYDEYNKTDAYITTLPNGKKSAVKSKYISTLLIILVSILLTFLISIIVGIAKNNLNIEYIVFTVIGCFIGIILLQSLLYPFIYKFGIEKSRIGIFVFVFIITGVATLLMKNNISVKVPLCISNFLNNYWMVILPLFVLLLLFISYKISQKIYFKKEF